MSKTRIPTFKPKPGALFPGVALIPFPGTPTLNAFYTGGMSDPRQWVRGELAGARVFDSLEEAQGAAKAAGRRLERRGDHFLAVVRES